MKISEEKIQEIIEYVSGEFECFGGGERAGDRYNPIAFALRAHAPMFAAGVSVELVVRTVLERVPKR